LKEIIVNLLSNAIKFSIGNLPIEVKTEWVNRRLSLSVKDYGIGIPPEYRQHLFERLYRASNVTNIGGTGLGLYITSKYVELMNGTIQYTSELQKGTQFVLTF
jgi:signal transduction histidine kinase